MVSIGADKNKTVLVCVLFARESKDTIGIKVLSGSYLLARLLQLSMLNGLTII